MVHATDFLTSAKAALTVAPPGHELRVHRWLELARPTVYVLTDGSGRTARSRLPSTSQVLADAGAERGALYGCFSDAELYAAMAAGDIVSLRHVMLVLTEALSRTGVDYVVADALEGFNPSHDMCRFLVNASLERMRRNGLGDVRNFDFLLEGGPDTCPAHLQTSAVTIQLDEADVDRKLAAARAYPELRAETDAALARFGPAAFRTECLRPVVDWCQGPPAMEHDPPYYERYGEHQVAAGHYERVIRYRAHLRPLAQALWRELVDTAALAATGR